MSYVKVQPDFTGGNPIEVLKRPDADGATTSDRQIISIGTNELENVIVDLLTHILNELRATRIQDSLAHNVIYENTDTLIEP